MGSTMTDLYEVLGVRRDASADEIKSAYRRLARQHHPDVNPGDSSAEEKFKEISQAYAILSDPEKKARYDQFGTTDDQGVGAGDFFGGAGNIGDLFEMFFGAANAGARRPRAYGRDGEDVRVDLELTLQDVLTGSMKTIEYRRMARCSECDGSGAEKGTERAQCPSCGGQGVVTRVQSTFLGQIRTQTTCGTCGGEGTVVERRCSTCQGRGLVATEERLTIEVPAGVEAGSHMTFRGKGGDGVGAGSPGDLFVVLDVVADPRFVRDGTTLHAKVEVTFAQAALGDHVVIDGVGEEVGLDIPAGTQPGTIVRVRGGGLPRLHGGARGDLLVEIQVRVPEKLSEAEAKLIREFAELRGEDQPKGGGSILGGLFKKKK